MFFFLLLSMRGCIFRHFKWSSVKCVACQWYYWYIFPFDACWIVHSKFNSPLLSFFFFCLFCQSLNEKFKRFWENTMIDFLVWKIKNIVNFFLQKLITNRNINGILMPLTVWYSNWTENDHVKWSIEMATNGICRCGFTATRYTHELCVWWV